MAQDKADVLKAIRELAEAAHKLSTIWHHAAPELSGQMAEGYPSFLPDFDEVPGELYEWHRTLSARFLEDTIERNKREGLLCACNATMIPYGEEPEHGTKVVDGVIHGYENCIDCEPDRGE